MINLDYIFNLYNNLINSDIVNESYDCHPILLEKYNEDLCKLKLLIDDVIPQALADPSLPTEVRDEMCDKLGMNYDDTYTGCDFGPEVRNAWSSYISEPKCMDSFKKLDCIRDKLCMLKDPKLAMQICGVATAATLYFMWKTFMHMKFDCEPCENKMLSNILFVTGSLPSKLNCVGESYDYKNDKALMKSFNTLIENAYSLNSLIVYDPTVPSIIKVILDEEFTPFRSDSVDNSMKPVMESNRSPKTKIFSKSKLYKEINESMNGFKLSVDKSFPYMNDTINFLENIYMMDGYDLWLMNENTSLMDVKNDINKKMKIDIISEAKSYNKRYASYVGSSLNTPLNESYFSPNMLSEAKSYVKKFINGLNNIMNIDENENIKRYSYKYMMDCYKHLNEVNDNKDPQDKVNSAVNNLGGSTAEAAEDIKKNKDKPGINPDQKNLASNIARDAENLNKKIDNYRKLEQENIQRQQKPGNLNQIPGKPTNQIPGKQPINASVTYPKYKNIRGIMEAEEDASTQNLKKKYMKKYKII